MGKRMTGEDRLLHEPRDLRKSTNEKFYKTRDTYKNHTAQFLKFYWRRFYGQKFANVRGDPIRAYVKKT